MNSLPTKSSNSLNKEHLSSTTSTDVQRPSGCVKRLIKNIVQINPKEIQKLGLAEQIAAAVNKLHASNDNISSSKKSSISKSKISTEKTCSANLLEVKSTLKKKLLDRSNLKLNQSDAIKGKEKNSETIGSETTPNILNKISTNFEKQSSHNFSKEYLPNDSADETKTTKSNKNVKNSENIQEKFKTNNLNVLELKRSPKKITILNKTEQKLESVKSKTLKEDLPKYSDNSQPSTSSIKLNYQSEKSSLTDVNTHTVANHQKNTDDEHQLTTGINAAEKVLLRGELNSGSNHPEINDVVETNKSLHETIRKRKVSQSIQEDNKILATNINKPKIEVCSPKSWNTTSASTAANAVDFLVSLGEAGQINSGSESYSDDELSYSEESPKNISHEKEESLSPNKNVVVIENKVLTDVEKIDTIFLQNLPLFETPQKRQHMIGENIVLLPQEKYSINIDNNTQHNDSTSQIMETDNIENQSISSPITSKTSDVSNIECGSDTKSKSVKNLSKLLEVEEEKIKNIPSQCPEVSDMEIILSDSVIPDTSSVDEQIILESKTNNNVCTDTLEEITTINQSSNLSIADSLEMEEPFYGFDEHEMIPDIFELNFESNDTQQNLEETQKEAINSMQSTNNKRSAKKNTEELVSEIITSTPIVSRETKRKKLNQNKTDPLNNDDDIIPPNKRSKNLSNNENKSKIIEGYLTNIDDSMNEIENTPKTKKPKKSVHPRLLLMTKREDLVIDPASIESSKPVGKLKTSEYRCGMCHEVVDKKLWAKHKAIHYGVGWHNEKDKIDLSSLAAVKRALDESLNENGFLKCRLCNNSYKSGLGIITHLQTCGLTEKEKRAVNFLTCEKCNKEYSRTSNHEKYCIANEPKLEEKIEDFVVGNSGRFKRQSMLKAENKLNNLDFGDLDDFIKITPVVLSRFYKMWKKEITEKGEMKCIGMKCSLTFQSFDEIRKHVNNCSYVAKKTYNCTKCNFKDETVTKVREHVKKKHPKADFSGSDDDNYEKGASSSSSDSDDSSENEENDYNDNSINRTSGKSSIVTMHGSKYKLAANSVDLKRDDKTYYEWAKYFSKKHLSDNVLFGNLSVNYTLSNSPLSSFKPKQNISMKFSHTNKLLNDSFNSTKTSSTWMELEMFKSKKFKNEELIFIGGPITCLKWIPIDKFKIPQYLAITYKNNFNKFIRKLNPEKKDTLILIYQVGITTEFNDMSSLGQFEYGISIDYGPINDIEFMPSGGYCSEMNRLGLLAVASSVNSDVFIYSLPIKAPTRCDKKSNFNIINMKEVIQLKLNVINKDEGKNGIDEEIQCMKIVWSKAKGHNILISGYSNGFIAIWNIENDNNLNLFLIEGVQTFAPISYFKISLREITGLNLHYNQEEPRWLMACSMDRVFKVLDIEDIMNPIILHEDITKSFIKSSTWSCTHQNPIFSATDDLFNSKGVRTVSPLLINYRQKRFARQSSAVNATDFNHWHYTMALGGNNGDFSIELVRVYDTAIIPKNTKKLYSYTDLICLNGEKIKKVIPINLKEFENKNETIKPVRFFETDYRDKYGIIFGPFEFMSNEKSFVDEKRNPPINMECYVKINCVACNDNENGCQLYAYGYENGFIRILCAYLKKMF